MSGSTITEENTAPGAAAVHQRVRERPRLDVADLAALFSLSPEAMTKKIQRTSFPEPLEVSGRTRLWSYVQIQDLIPQETKQLLPAHIVLDPDAPHEVEYRGSRLTSNCVEFWFGVDGEYAVAYTHRTFASAGKRDALNLVTDHLFCTENEKVSVTGLSRRGAAFGALALTDFTAGVPTASGEYLYDSDVGALLDVEALLGLRLPMWSLGCEDPELMVAWTPGADPVEYRVSSDLTRSYASNAVISGQPHVEFRMRNATQTAAYLRHYVEDRDQRWATVYPQAADELVVLENICAGSADCWVKPAPQTLAHMLTLEVPDDIVARSLISELREPIPFMPVGLNARCDSGGLEPIELDPAIAETVGAYLLASFTGFSRRALEWGRGEDGTVFARRPEGRWWSTGKNHYSPATAVGRGLRLDAIEYTADQDELLRTSIFKNQAKADGYLISAPSSDVSAGLMTAWALRRRKLDDDTSALFQSDLTMISVWGPSVGLFRGPTEDFSEDAETVRAIYSETFEHFSARAGYKGIRNLRQELLTLPDDNGAVAGLSPANEALMDRALMRQRVEALAEKMDLDISEDDFILCRETTGFTSLVRFFDAFRTTSFHDQAEACFATILALNEDEAV